jgi:NTE family protein
MGSISAARPDFLLRVQPEPVEERTAGRTHGIALCLSGGGYRAMLFHTGTLWRLNDIGWLPRLQWVSSVSGGSITAAVLGAIWKKLDFDQNGVARAFTESVVDPVRRMAAITIDIGAIVRGILGPGSISRSIIKAYRQHLFGDHTLQDLPDNDGPRFVINATNVQSGVLFRFSRPYTWDYRVGRIDRPDFSLAEAVAASSAFPPFLSPVILKVDQTRFAPGTGTDLQFPPYTTRIVLTDGGVYDNLALESAWKRFDTILVSDGGGRMRPEPRPARNWLTHSIRILNIIDRQVRSLRYRDLIDAYESGHLKGAYWGVYTNIADYGVPSLECPIGATTKLAEVPTRLRRLPDSTQEKLINWGYAVCDAAMRAYVDKTLPSAAAFPYPNRPIA